MQYRDYDWEDVEPIQQDEDESHVAIISYTQDFIDAMSIFRAVVVKHELSERALALTQDIIEMNPAHYSVWDYRFEIVKEIGNKVFDYKLVGLTPSSVSKPKVGENGVWLNQFTHGNSKNYQVWNYRQHLADVENIKWYHLEQSMIKEVLKKDAKNFHAWSHYKWLAQLAKENMKQALPSTSLLLETEEMLQEDVLNNSVWSFRYFVLQLYPELRNDQSECTFVAEQITKRPSNESVWSYFRGYSCDLGGELAPELAKTLAKDYKTEPRAVELLAELTQGDESVELYKKLAEMEPERAEFWKSFIVS